ncbi:MAG: VOC family protein [Actinomycetota bacterium]
MIFGLDHVQLAMPRGGEDEAREFYVGVLGMTEIPKPEPLASRGGVWFVAGAAHVHLGVDDAFVPAKKGHPALLVDLPAIRKALTEAGVEVVEDESLDGVERIYAHDPFGNRIEFIANGGGFSQG